MVNPSHFVAGKREVYKSPMTSLNITKTCIRLVVTGVVFLLSNAVIIFVGLSLGQSHGTLELKGATALYFFPTGLAAIILYLFSKNFFYVNIYFIAHVTTHVHSFMEGALLAIEGGDASLFSPHDSGVVLLLTSAYSRATTQIQGMSIAIVAVYLIFLLMHFLIKALTKKA